MNETKSTELRDKKGLTEKEFLAAYIPGNWQRPSCTADLALICGRTSQEILLIRRGNHPSLGKWALPGGFAEPNETVDSAASRELFEETGVKGLSPTLLGTFSDPGRDPRGWTITSLYGAFTETKPDYHAGDDAREAGWFSVSMKKENGLISYTLKKDDIAINASVAFTLTESPFGSSYSLREIENDGLAFDHSKLIALALLKLHLN